jgi:hypothetical protein
MQEPNQRHRLAPARWSLNWKRRNELNILRALVFRFFFGIAQRESLAKRKASCWGTGNKNRPSRQSFVRLENQIAFFFASRGVFWLQSVARCEIRKFGLLRERLAGVRLLLRSSAARRTAIARPFNAPPSNRYESAQLVCATLVF